MNDRNKTEDEKEKTKVYCGKFLILMGSGIIVKGRPW